MPPVSSFPPPAAALLLAAALGLGACAQSPETVAATPVDETRYAYLTCPELGHEVARLNRSVAVLSTEQSAKRTNDAVGWTRLQPAAHSARTRDIRPHLALRKGEAEAVERAMARRCPGTVAS